MFKNSNWSCFRWINRKIKWTAKNWVLRPAMGEPSSGMNFLLLTGSRGWSGEEWQERWLGSMWSAALPLFASKRWRKITHFVRRSQRSGFKDGLDRNDIGNTPQSHEVRPSLSRETWFSRRLRLARCWVYSTWRIREPHADIQIACGCFWNVAWLRAAAAAFSIRRFSWIPRVEICFGSDWFRCCRRLTGLWYQRAISHKGACGPDDCNRPIIIATSQSQGLQPSEDSASAVCKVCVLCGTAV